jgi:hypothetical protein
VTRLAGVALLAALAACGNDPSYLPLEDLMDPATCEGCHPTHVREWSGSMHAYAADDPIFRAMNARGQRETDGALGAFCVNCHAPMAVRLGLTTDGLNLDEVPAYAKGITCYFCHSVADVTGTHNNPLVLASDGVMRGGYRDTRSSAHATAYSPYLDSSAAESSAMCGACHDIVTPSGIHLERTFAEWSSTIFATGEPRSLLSCGQCHMATTPDVIADVQGQDVPLRQRSDHQFAGLDVALTPFPELEAQREAIDRILKGALLPRLCVQPLDGGIITYRLDNLAGHHFPSGASNDRRVWAEIVAYDASDAVVFSSGVVPDGVDPGDAGDPTIWEIRDHATDADGEPTEMFWDITDITQATLRPRITNDPGSPDYDHSTTTTYSVAGVIGDITRVTARVLVRPIPFHLVDDLEASGDLSGTAAADIRDQIPTFVVEGTVLEWTPDVDDLDRCVKP